MKRAITMAMLLASLMMVGFAPTASAATKNCGAAYPVMGINSWVDTDSPSNPIDEDGNGSEGTTVTYSASYADAAYYSLDGGSLLPASPSPWSGLTVTADGQPHTLTMYGYCSKNNHWSTAATATITICPQTGCNPSSLVTGIYMGWHNWTGVDSFYSWLSGYHGQKLAHEFVDNQYGWGTIGNCLDPGWSTWVNTDDANRRFSMSLPLMPSSDPGDFAGVAAGTYDSYWQQCASQLQNGGGTSDAIIRLGWEANGNTFPWAIPPNNSTALSNYKAAFAHVANVMRATDPNLRFEWNMNAALDYSGYTLEQMYPGDSVVDYISATAYDYCNSTCQGNGLGNTDSNRWNSWVGNGTNDNGLLHSYNFAKAQQKPINETEWGLWPTTRSPGGGGDNPLYIDHMHDWLTAHYGAYQIYNNVSDHLLDNYPNAKAEYQAKFGV